MLWYMYITFLSSSSPVHKSSSNHHSLDFKSSSIQYQCASHTKSILASKLNYIYQLSIQFLIRKQLNASLVCFAHYSILAYRLDQRIHSSSHALCLISLQSIISLHSQVVLYTKLVKIIIIFSFENSSMLHMCASHTKAYSHIEYFFKHMNNSTLSYLFSLYMYISLLSSSSPVHNFGKKTLHPNLQMLLLFFLFW